MTTLAAIALFGALLGPALIAVAGPGYQLGLWPLMVAFGALMGAGALVAILGGLLGLGVGIWALVEQARQPLLMAIPAIIVGSVVGATFLAQAQAAQSGRFPPIHDITTDFDNPPAFSATMAERRAADEARNPVDYLTTIESGPESMRGQSIPELQQRAYPDIEPVRLDTPPADAYATALEAARAMGWTIHTTEPPGETTPGRIEATDRTFWFGFRDDVVIRIAADGDGDGTIVDARSKSRIGLGDIGKNAERLRSYFQQAGWR